MPRKPAMASGWTVQASQSRCGAPPTRSRTARHRLSRLCGSESESSPPCACSAGMGWGVRRPLYHACSCRYQDSLASTCMQGAPIQQLLLPGPRSRQQHLYNTQHTHRHTGPRGTLPCACVAFGPGYSRGTGQPASNAPQQLYTLPLPQADVPTSPCTRHRLASCRGNQQHTPKT